MSEFISIIIPNYNGESTIGKCLEAAFSSGYDNFEVIVVDDCSADNSIEIIKRFPCKLVALKERSGASKARNAGARNSKGKLLFFIDADCVVKEDALSVASAAYATNGPDVVVGGTYTPMSYDNRFFSIFQSVFINYSETKNLKNPDYIATHAMAIDAETFRKSGGFPEAFMPIIEDVEYSHRIRREGYKLIMNPDLLVQHIFNYSFSRSMKNAFKKSKFWTIYSINNKDLLVDSGTASVELKVNVLSFFLNIVFLLLWIFTLNSLLLYPVPLIFAVNLFVNRRLIRAFYKTKGLFFAFPATLYYTLLYPLAVGTGAIAGVMKHYLSKKKGF
ncbi:Glycosyl transferase, family 2 [hydrothermal vent metagenome]|uniref:Glycosyl transferase, family 2 n=1 Tax=hydrothermal vent metagenome TaxID=652676 RepID=A0A3B1DD76_9ZZZZ